MTNQNPQVHAQVYENNFSESLEIALNFRHMESNFSEKGLGTEKC